MKLNIISVILQPVSAWLSSARAVEYQFGVEIPKLTKDPAVYRNTTAYQRGKVTEPPSRRKLLLLGLFRL